MEDFESNLRSLREMLRRAGEGHRTYVPEEDHDLFDDCEGLCFKFLGHATSVVSLVRGSYFDVPEEAFLDRPSVAAVCRASWEACLVFHYIAADSANPEERRLRHRSWQYCSGQQRQGYHAISDWEKARLVEDKAELAKVRQLIEENQEFHKWPAKKQKTLLEEGAWPRPSWRKLADCAGISPRYGHDHYDYLCERAHSGNISVRELKVQQTPENQKVLKDASFGLLCVGAALLVEDYLLLFPALRPSVLRQELDQTILTQWLEEGRRTPTPEELG